MQMILPGLGTTGAKVSLDSSSSQVADDSPAVLLAISASPALPFAIAWATEAGTATPSASPAFATSITPAGDASPSRGAPPSLNVSNRIPRLPLSLVRARRHGGRQPAGSVSELPGHTRQPVGDSLDISNRPRYGLMY